MQPGSLYLLADGRFRRDHAGRLVQCGARMMFSASSQFEGSVDVTFLLANGARPPSRGVAIEGGEPCRVYRADGERDGEWFWAWDEVEEAAAQAGWLKWRPKERPVQLPSD